MKIPFIAAAFVAALAFLAPRADAQSIVPPAGTFPYYPSGVGPAVAGTVDLSSVPDKALEFIGKHFKDDVITEVEKEYDDDSYDVDLASGIELEFNARGEWTEVDIRRGAIPAETVRHIVPDHVWRKLEEQKATARVETIKRSQRNIKVELRGADGPDLVFKL